VNPSRGGNQRLWNKTSINTQTVLLEKFKMSLCLFLLQQLPACLPACLSQRASLQLPAPACALACLPPIVPASLHISLHLRQITICNYQRFMTKVKKIMKLESDTDNFQF
jgi:hypothetical protein